MSDTSVGSTSLYSYEDYINSQKIRTPNQNLGKDEFLSLLVAQMQYQDPLEPTSDTQFVAQLAQFSALEQINALNDTMTMFQSYSLAGKYVYGVKTLENGLKQEVTGFVKAVMNDNGEAWALVGDTYIKCSEISEVYDGATATGENPLLNNINLIGKYVEGQMEIATGETITNEDGTTKEETKVVDIKGIVARVAVDAKHGMVAYLEDGSVIALSNIKDVRAEAPAAEPTTPETVAESYGLDGDSNRVYDNGDIVYAIETYEDGSVLYADGKYLDADGTLHDAKPE